MYNEKIKNAFIDDCVSKKSITRGQLLVVFHRIEPFETQFGKDCAEFSIDEVLHFYKACNAKSAQVLYNYNSQLKAYTIFAQRIWNKAPFSGGVYNAIASNDMRACLPKNGTKLYTEDEIKELQSKIDVVDAAIIQCIWEGIEGPKLNDLTAITVDDIDINRRLLIVRNIRRPVSDYLIELLQRAFNAENMSQLYSPDGRPHDISQFKGRLCKNNGDSDDKRYRWVFRRLTSIKDRFGLLDFNMKNIKTSGLICCLKKSMEETGRSFSQLVHSDTGMIILGLYGYKVDVNSRCNFVKRFKDLFD